ncbi:MAG TPA: alpha/beta-type small acid-soluble spore protein [Thermaerobacter sp.]
MARRRRARGPLVPGARPGLERLKLQVAGDIGLLPAHAATPAAYEAALERHKWNVAAELGLTGRIQAAGWGEMPARDCGAIGGRMGGRLGGEMVRRMVALAQGRLTGTP